MEAHGTTREVGGFPSNILTLFAMIFTPLLGCFGFMFAFLRSKRESGPHGLETITATAK